MSQSGSKGQPGLSGDPETFKDFQAFTDVAREFAARYGLHRTLAERMKHVLMDQGAANDNAPEGANLILLSNAYMNMLRCWVQCDKDMVRTKLSYLDTNTY